MFINALRLIASIIFFTCASGYAALPETIAKIKPSIVGIGTYSRVAIPNSRFLGTGFFVHNSQYVATNAHVIPEALDERTKEKLVVFVGSGRNPKIHIAEVVATVHRYDLAILKIAGAKPPALKLSKQPVREGEEYAFTGFPIGNTLGLYPVTHRGIISAIAPIVIPARTSKQLTIRQLKNLKKPYDIYQLDATAYPGNSGSPVYNTITGEVVAVINKVLVKSTKESALTNPTAITYAIPIKYLEDMVKQL